MPKTLWRVNNARYIITCQNCQKKRLIFSWKPEGNSWYRPIHNLGSVLEDINYEYNCGDNLFGIKEDEFVHPISTNIFHVKIASLCSMEIESLYNQAKNTIIFLSVCSDCGMNNEFVDENVISQETDNR